MSIWFLCLFTPVAVAAQTRALDNPETVIVRSGSLTLRALLWRPEGRGPFPAVLFCAGSGQNPSPDNVGRKFAEHGYIFLALYRRGQGLSADQGEAVSVLVTRERDERGDDAANRLQLQLLEGEQLDEQRSALLVLKALRGVDSRRIALVGHSFGGSLAFLLAEEDRSIRAIINFGGAAASWNRSPPLRERLIAATRKLKTPVFSIYAANDYSTAPGKVLEAELSKMRKVNRLKIFPPFGQTEREGHHLIYLSIESWENDVFTFLDEVVGRQPRKTNRTTRAKGQEQSASAAF